MSVKGQMAKNNYVFPYRVPIIEFIGEGWRQPLVEKGKANLLDLDVVDLGNFSCHSMNIWKGKEHSNLIYVLWPMAEMQRLSRQWLCSHIYSQETDWAGIKLFILSNYMYITQLDTQVSN